MSMTRASTNVSRIIKAPRRAVSKAFLDPDALAKWRAAGHRAGWRARLRGARRRHLPDVAHLPGPATVAGRQDLRRHRHLPGPVCRTGSRREDRRSDRVRVARPRLRG